MYHPYPTILGAYPSLLSIEVLKKYKLKYMVTKQLPHQIRQLSIKPNFWLIIQDFLCFKNVSFEDHNSEIVETKNGDEGQPITINFMVHEKVKLVSIFNRLFIFIPKRAQNRLFHYINHCTYDVPIERNYLNNKP